MKTSFLLAAVSGIVMGATSLAQADTTPSSDLVSGVDRAAQRADAPSQGPAQSAQKLDSDAGTKHACKGQNACKGQGGCKTDKNACKGQNGCKGQGGCRTDGKPMK
ncbi:MAG TPA: hypothetical protein VGI39_15945 [Polyangiaceae bacterium]|jgi:hypothetical protein